MPTLPLTQLVDQLCAEQRKRWRADDPLMAEDLLTQHPRVAADFEAAFDVVYNEFLLRQELQKSPELDAFCQRFPRFSERLRQQVRFRLALGSQLGSTVSFSAALRLTDSGFSLLEETEASASPPPPPPGYTILRGLGSGSSGQVFEAVDDRRQDHVALKTLSRNLPALTSHLKNEFRTLAELNHHNLVQLYELREHEGRYWIAMELVRGRDAVTALRADVADSGRFTNRVRHFMSQMVDALDFLHSHGVLHRDIKPANLMCTRSDRAVLLDFGLARAVPNGLRDGVQASHIGGTLAYVAPEILRQQQPGPSCDWYSLGATLYEILTGQLPFSGTAPQICHQKTTEKPVLPLEVAPETSPILNQLCMELLERQPDRRADAQRVRKLLLPAGSGKPRQHSATRRPEPASEGTGTPASPSQNALFVGRLHERAELQRAYARAAASPVVALVTGESGIGKTAFLQQALSELGEADDILILTGRCYRNESIPFKAIDSVIEQLGRHLRRLPPDIQQLLLPADSQMLAGMFPVLGGLGDITAKKESSASLEAETRERGFAALTELLRRLTGTVRLVISIDDLQWGDVDSAQLLSHLLHAPHAPPLLLVGTARTDSEQSPFLSSFLDRWSHPDSPTELVRISLNPLTPGEAMELARASLAIGGQPQQVEEAGRLAHDITSDAGGHPYLIREFAQASATAPWQPAGTAPRDALAAALWSRTQELPASARTLLEMVALTSRPVPVEDLIQASLVPEETRSALRLLEHQRLIRYLQSESSAPVDTYHDRVRETLLARLPADVAIQHHQRLASVFRSSSGRNADLAAGHLMAAGQTDEAYPLALDAAERASRKLAFEHRVDCLKLAIDCNVARGREHLNLMRQYGDALARVARVTQATEVYLQAAELNTATAADRRLLMRLAGTHLTEYDDPVRGMPLIEDAIRPVGVRIPSSPRRALLYSAWHDFRLRRRGTEFTPRPESEVPPEQLERLEAYQTLARLTNHRGMERASLFPRFAIEALDSGHLESIGLALSNMVGTLWWQGERARQRIAAYEEVLQSQVLPHVSPAVQTLFHNARTLVSLGRGDWPGAERHASEALRMGLAQPTPIRGLSVLIRTYSLMAKYCLGRFPELAELVPRLIFRAETGIRSTAAFFRISFWNSIWLAADAPAMARDQLERATREWLHQPESIDLFHDAIGWLNLALYERDHASAEAIMANRWTRLRRSGVLHIPIIRILLRGVRGGIPLMRPSTGFRGRRAVQSALRDANRLTRERNPMADVLAAMLRAQCAHRRGNESEAIEQLAAVESASAALHMEAYTTMARWLRGRLLGGSRGEELRTAAEDICRRLGIRNVERFATMLFPGFS